MMKPCQLFGWKYSLLVNPKAVCILHIKKIYHCVAFYVALLSPPTRLQVPLGPEVHPDKAQSNVLDNAGMNPR